MSCILLRYNLYLRVSVKLGFTFVLTLVLPQPDHQPWRETLSFFSKIQRQFLVVNFLDLFLINRNEVGCECQSSGCHLSSVGGGEWISNLKLPMGWDRDGLRKWPLWKPSSWRGLNDWTVCTVPSAVSDWDAWISGFQSSAAKKEGTWRCWMEQAVAANEFEGCVCSPDTW